MREQRKEGERVGSWEVEILKSPEAKKLRS